MLVGCARLEEVLVGPRLAVRVPRVEARHARAVQRVTHPGILHAEAQLVDDVAGVELRPARIRLRHVSKKPCLACTVTLP